MYLGLLEPMIIVTAVYGCDIILRSGGLGKELVLESEYYTLFKRFLLVANNMCGM